MKRLLNNIFFIHLLLVSVYILFLLNYFLEFIRFSSPLLNECTGIICLLIPFILFFHGFRFKLKGLKIVNGVLLIIPILISIVFLFFESFVLGDIIKTGTDPSFERIKALELSKSNVNVYRTNGGATTDFGIIARQEMKVLPGILIVKQFFNEYHKYDVELNRIGGDSLRLEGKVVVLKKYVYL
ncbi:MAG: hypothetical protein ACM3RX_05975 [Methanococcaceae archaeon]